jgi:tRNA(Ile)-lysidine synthase
MINIKPFVPAHTTIIVGFSGGPDSTALLILLSRLQQKLNLTLIAAHLDHQWRPESNQDAIWCKNFVQALPNIKFVHAQASELKFKTKYDGSKEALGRKLRRAFLMELAQQHQADAIALAHHCDDQLETFFIRLIRGSSITGIAGMSMQDGLFFRPLLHVSKQQILDFLAQEKITYLQDSTNNDTRFLRNKIRHHLIPNLNQIDARFTSNALRCIQQLQKTDEFLDIQAKNLIHSLGPEQIDIEGFLVLPELMQHRILLHLLIAQKIACTPSQAFFDEILRFLNNKISQKTHQIGTNVIVQKNHHRFNFKSL